MGQKADGTWDGEMSKGGWMITIFSLVVIFGLAAILLGPIMIAKHQEITAESNKKVNDLRLQQNGEIQAYSEFGKIHVVYYDDYGKHHLVINKSDLTVTKQQDEIDLTKGDNP